MARDAVQRGRLTVLLGAAPGVGKTTAMLGEGARLADAGRDVVVALVESHGRTTIESRLGALERVPLRRVAYRDTSFEELDVDAVLARRPEVVLVDELAHTNVPGSRHEKRWQDVEELLALGIDVITNLNVGHLDSLNDAVESMTGVAQHETVPDVVVATAERVELVDPSPESLQTRLAEGDVFGAGDTTAALRGYYRAEKVSALRDLALTWLATHGVERTPSGRAAAPGRPVVAALTGAPEGRHVVRRAAQIAELSRGELIGVHVREPNGLVQSHPTWLEEQQRLLAELGGRYAEVPGVDVARAVLDLCRSEHAGHLVLGASRRRRPDELLHGSVIERAIRNAGPVEIHVVPSQQSPKGRPSSRTWPHAGERRVPLPRRRRQLAWVLAVFAPLGLTAALIPVRSSVGIAGALFAALLGVVATATIGGLGPGAVAIVVGFVAADFFFAVPYYSLRVDRLIDLIALISFAAIAGVVGVLVDVLTRQGVRMAGTRTEAEVLTRLAAESLGLTPEELPRLAGTLRNAFDLDTVAVLQRAPEGWSPEFVVGECAPRQPEDTPFTAELSDGRVLTLTSRPRTARDLEMVRTFIAVLRHRRERDQLTRLGPGGPDGLEVEGRRKFHD